MKNKADLVIIVDTREQAPYFQTGEYDGAAMFIRQKLDTGDYSVKGFEHEICIERKELTDFAGSMGKERARFKRELERMKDIKHKYLVIEGTLSAIKAYCRTGAVKHARKGFVRPSFGGDGKCGLHYNAALQGLLAISLKYGVIPVTCIDREEAELVTFSLLKKFLGYKREGEL